MTEATTPAPTDNRTLPNSSEMVVEFRDCMNAVVIDKEGKPAQTGLEALMALSDRLGTVCPGLRLILESSAVQTAYQTFLRQDAEAVRQQAQLMQEASIANTCLLAAGVFSGLVLATDAAFPDSMRITLWLGIVILLLGAVAALFSHIARDQGRVARWLARRGEAEIARLTVFRTVAEKAAEAGPIVATYVLAVISRHLLDNQRDWLGLRAARHRRSSELTSFGGGLAVALAFVGGSGAIIASQVKGSAWIVLAGVVGAALAAYATNREALRRDRANAERYEKAQVALDSLAARTDDIAAHLAAGEPKALVAFTEAIAEQLSTEHKQWLEGTTQAETVLAKLDDQLNELAKGHS